MANWGMGITQSDTYCEVYDDFLEEYDRGKPLSAIKEDILDDFLIEFDEHDGVLHDVYFAIGKAEWMCGGISDDIYKKIAHIIQSGENISFYKSLEATPSELKQRQKYLEKFLAALSVPRGKIKKRKIPVEKYVAKSARKLPPFRCGDIFAYEVDGKYRLLGFISREKFWSTYAAYCYVWTERYAHPPTPDALLDERILPLGYFTAETFPSLDKLHCIGNCQEIIKLNLIHPGVLYEKWHPATRALAKEENIAEDYPDELCISLRACLQRIQALRSIHDAE